MRIEEIAEGCHVGPDEDDVDGQTLLIEYPTLFPSSDVAYVAPRVRIEAGARSALDPSLTRTIARMSPTNYPTGRSSWGTSRVIAPAGCR